MKPKTILYNGLVHEVIEEREDGCLAVHKDGGFYSILDIDFFEADNRIFLFSNKLLTTYSRLKKIMGMR